MVVPLLGSCAVRAGASVLADDGRGVDFGMGFPGGVAWRGGWGPPDSLLNSPMVSSP